MRKETGRRNWLLVLLVLGVVIFGLGYASRQPASAETVAPVDPRTPLERYVDAYAKFARVQLERFQAAQATLQKAQWDDFFSTMVRISIAGVVLGGLGAGGYFARKYIPIRLRGIQNKTNLLSTPYGTYWVEEDEYGNLTPRPIDGQKESSGGAYTIVKGNDVIEVKDGKVITPVEDAADFLDRAIKSGGYNAKSKELPRHESMGVSGAKWDSMVHQTLGGLFKVENRGDGMRTYCAKYPDLGSTYFAIKTGEVALPEKKKAKK